MLTSAKRGNPRQSWARRLWPFPVVGVHGTENPRVGGSTPSQATSPQRLSATASRRLALHFEHAAGGLVFLAALLAPAHAAAQVVDVTTPAPGRLRAAAVDAGWMATGAGLDLGASRWAFARCSTCYEGNPVMRSVPTAIVIKAAGIGMGTLVCDHLRQHGHPRGARIFRWVVVGAQIALAGNAIAASRR